MNVMKLFVLFKGFILVEKRDLKVFVDLFLNRFMLWDKEVLV